MTTERDDSGEPEAWVRASLAEAERALDAILDDPGRASVWMKMARIHLADAATGISFFEDDPEDGYCRGKFERLMETYAALTERRSGR